MTTQELPKFYSQPPLQEGHKGFYERDYIPFKKIPLWIIHALKGTKATVLDLGCETGLSSQEFFKIGYEVFGIDQNSHPEALQGVQKQPFKQLFCQSLEEPIPLETHTCDAAVLLGEMEFIKNPPALFAEVHRVLREGGFFGITIPKKLPKAIKQKIEIFDYYKKEMEPLFRASGFHVHHVEEFQGFVSDDESVHYYGYLLKKI